MESETETLQDNNSKFSAVPCSESLIFIKSNSTSEADDAYDHVLNQILLMDPLPSIGKAYSMIARVEKQRQLNSAVQGLDREEIMTIQIQDSRKQGFMKRKSFADKKQMYCDNCKKNDHIKDNCFELKGFPDWYKDLIEQRKKNGKQPINRALNTQGEKGEMSCHTVLDENSISEIIRKELKKALQNQELSQDLSNLVDYENFAGLFSIVFLKEQCLVQDLVTRKVIAVGRQRGKLYLLDQRHKTEEKTEHIGILQTYAIPHNKEKAKRQVVDNGNLSHNRLGHASQDVMLHLPYCK
ncbi:uncharacterized protein LOC105179992 [Sesamum indicum]|uniref:Uncharacterized protein LOC105179992 n=1 Tax=Sesamum indicum TaxID=4182 RepID=A0A6I9UMY4_SESIN|nr:uncharacterized protein LOC105179992 [Sesamum indicum]